MLIDTNAYLGHWPFRQLRHNTAPKLLKLMDKKGIDQAWASSISGVWYKNPQTANEELARETRRHRDRLVPFAVINPKYVDWEHDLQTCADAHGFRGLRLYPHYHDYSLADACCDELVTAAAERGLVVSIPIRQTDSRPLPPAAGWPGAACQLCSQSSVKSSANSSQRFWSISRK